MKTLFLLVVALASVGCMSAYTSIEPVGDKTFYVTKTEQGFFKTSGTLYHCTAEGKAMTCSEVDSR